MSGRDDRLVDLAAALQQFGNLVECAGFRDVELRQQTGHGFAQRAAEQRMVVGNHQPIVRAVNQRRTTSSMSRRPRHRRRWVQSTSSYSFCSEEFCGATT